MGNRSVFPVIESISLLQLSEKLQDTENEAMAKIVELEKQLMQRNKELDVIRVSGWDSPGWIQGQGVQIMDLGQGNSPGFPVLSLGRISGGILCVGTQSMDRNPSGCARGWTHLLPQVWSIPAGSFGSVDVPKGGSIQNFSGEAALGRAVQRLSGSGLFWSCPWNWEHSLLLCLSRRSTRMPTARFTH